MAAPAARGVYLRDATACQQSAEVKFINNSERILNNLIISTYHHAYEKRYGPG